MFNKFELELEKKYKCNFKVTKVDELIEIICDNKEIESDEEKIDEILEIASKYLSEEDLWNIGIVYDYLGEIKEERIQIDAIFESSREILELKALELGKVKFSYNLKMEEKKLGNERNIFKKVIGFKGFIEKAFDLVLNDHREEKYQFNCKHVL
ncbi:hypothetical protein QTI77_14610 [Clostridium perfringens]|nr:hypothetical protein [Clostridium perfringens]MDK0796641.1 hypothetical protein [Clostridium perfringens]MDM0889259.1 hypothetical protein [Clostridium perfringens]MDM0901096.1 hypothetical protein [Clostridium perfringens]MDM0907007.1 hypothetical protein [Clostridium perfringens]